MDQKRRCTVLLGQKQGYTLTTVGPTQKTGHPLSTNHIVKCYLFVTDYNFYSVRILLYGKIIPDLFVRLFGFRIVLDWMWFDRLFYDVWFDFCRIIGGVLNMTFIQFWSLCGGF